MKTVIVPSNGNAAHIENPAVAAEILPGEKIHFIFLDVRAIPDGYQNLITSKHDQRKCGGFSNEFCEAVDRFTASRQNCTAAIDHIYGDSVPVFRNYLEYRGTDLVIFDQAQWTDHPHFQAHEIFRMVMRSGAEVLYIPDSKLSGHGSAVRINTNEVKYHSKFSGHKGVQPGMEKIGSNVIERNTEFKAGNSITVAPASVRVSYNSVDQMLNELQNQVVHNHMLITQASRLKRYFLKQSTVDRMLLDSKRELLWLRK